MGRVKVWHIFFEVRWIFHVVILFWHALFLFFLLFFSFTLDTFHMFMIWLFRKIRRKVFTCQLWYSIFWLIQGFCFLFFIDVHQTITLVMIVQTLEISIDLFQIKGHFFKFYLFVFLDLFFFIFLISHWIRGTFNLRFYWHLIHFECV